MSAPDPKPSPLFFNSARGSRQSPFGRPGSVRQSPSAPRPSTPTSSPLKPRDTPSQPSQPSQHAPPWLKTAATAEPSSPRDLRSPSREPLSPARADYTRSPRSPPTSTARPLSTASLAAMFDGGRRSSTPPVERAVELVRAVEPERAMEEPENAVEPAMPALIAAPNTATINTLTNTLTSTSSPTHVQRPPRPQIIRQTTSDALSKLPPPLLHSMRESFSVMDRDDDGHVTAPDVADMLSQLGLSATPSALAAYFHGAPDINLATYLNTLSDLLATLSRPAELTAAFEAFDDADDGQIDLAELKDALLHTAPEPGEHRLSERDIDAVVDGFSGRRAFGTKARGRGEVFRYHDFMASLTGGDLPTPA